MITVFSGYNQRAVIAFLRTLQKNKIESYCIIASGEEDTILKTCYRERVIYVRKIKQLDLNEIIDALKLAINMSDEKSVFIAPSTEALNRFLLQYREIFEQMGCIIPLVDKELYEQVSDKGKFYMLCIENEISVPLEYPKEDVFSKPLVAKPKKYVSACGEVYSPIFLLSEQEYMSFLNKHNMDDFDFQEYLNGGISIYLLFYFSRFGEVFFCTQRNLAQQPGGKSVIAACYDKFYGQEKIAEEYIKLFKKIGFHGLVMVEIRLLNGKDYMIEANPRFWGPSQLFCDMNYNFFEFMLKDYGFMKQIYDISKNESAVYFWSGGAKKSVLEDMDYFLEPDGMKILQENYSSFVAADIYQKEDTMAIYNIELLEKLYMQNSKHSNYQALPSALAEILDEEKLKIKTRQEWERLSYIKKHMDFSGKSVLEIGGNTGFFTFEILKAGACHVDYYEGNQIHAAFVRAASETLKTEDKLSVYSEYFLFEKEKNKKYDVALCLNVVHHLGDDFKDINSKDTACMEMIASVNSLSEYADILIFQMGFNWKGDCKEPLFKDGTKKEMKLFLEEGTKDFWDIIFVGIAERKNNAIVYNEMDIDNSMRQDDMGEFLNRPIFIMKSKGIRKDA